jgi:hypothetical protein
MERAEGLLRCVGGHDPLVALSMPDRIFQPIKSEVIAELPKFENCV